MKRLHIATFDFGLTTVSFIGARVRVTHRGELVKEVSNKWTSTHPENDGVMGRSYKPRVSDAMAILEPVQRRLDKLEKKIAIRKNAIDQPQN